jgi:hypothetical protein
LVYWRAALNVVAMTILYRVGAIFHGTQMFKVARSATAIRKAWTKAIRSPATEERDPQR